MAIGDKVLPMVENAKYAAFAQRLNAAMDQAGLSITDIKERMGVTYEMARRYTLGTAMPRLGNMGKLAEIVGVTTSYLAYGVDIKPSDPDSAYEELKREAARRGMTTVELISPFISLHDRLRDRSVSEHEPSHIIPLQNAKEIKVRSFAQIINNEQGTDTMIVFGEFPESAYGYRLESDHMEGQPVFIQRGAILVINPDLDPVEGDVILANVANHPTIGLFERVGGKCMAVATRDKIPAVEVTPEQVLGVVLEWKVQHRNPARS